MSSTNNSPINFSGLQSNGLPKQLLLNTHIKLVIDQGGNYDSAVFLEAGSF
jgi:hypothetical protein